MYPMWRVREKKMRDKPHITFITKLHCGAKDIICGRKKCLKIMNVYFSKSVLSTVRAYVNTCIANKFKLGKQKFLSTMYFVTEFRLK